MFVITTIFILSQFIKDYFDKIFVALTSVKERKVETENEILWTTICWLVGWWLVDCILQHINPYRLFNTKSCLYIYTKYI